MTISRRLATMTACILLVAGAGCGSKDGPAANGAEFKNIDHEDKVSSPFTVEMEADDIEIVAAGEAKPGEGHFHILIDTPCTEGGEVIPHDADHRHFNDGETEAELELEPGTYNLCLQVGDGEDVAFASDEPGAVADKTHQIQITVE
jgi:hypothetical protein